MAKSGPVDPVVMAFIIPKYFKKYQKVYGNTLENIIFGNLRPKNFENYGPCVHPTFWIFEIQKFGILKLIHIATQPHSHIATQPYSHIAKQLHSHRATQPHSYIATKNHKGGAAVRSPPPLWRRPQAASFVAMQLCGSVAMQLCSYVAIWLCGYVAMWLCGYVAMWLLVGCWLLVVGCWLLVVGLTLISRQ